MVQPSKDVDPIEFCNYLKTRRKTRYPYSEYYIGKRDEDLRKYGEGENHWTGAESLETYKGNFIRDTMHGKGTYRWRYRGPENRFVTYEGYFYCNCLHGYGTMSYPDGRTFEGLFYKNKRFGPGVQSYAHLREDVGLWLGPRLLRLAWMPHAPSVAPDFLSSNIGRMVVEAHRTILVDKKERPAESNNAIEMLKQHGAQPMAATKNWRKLYPKHCTDLQSPLCYKPTFEHEYYNRAIHTLQEVENVSDSEKPDYDHPEDYPVLSLYYAWNDNNVTLNMMKHCYQLDYQRELFRVNVESILSGPRTVYKPPGTHELDCRSLLLASFLGEIGDVAQLIVEGIHPDIADMQGNNTVMYAACGDQPDVIQFLVEAGANIDSYNDSCCTPLGVALLRYTCIQNDISPNDVLKAIFPPSIATPPCMIMFLLLNIKK